MAVQAKELMIGNYINSTANGIIELTPQLFKDCIDGMIEGDLQLIQLTEEILLKCGFEKNMHIYHYKDIIRIDWFEIEFMVRFKAEIDEDVERYVEFKNMEIKYLHQLQNLYFALTGEELEVKL